jgi:ribosomal protein L44E
MSIRCLGCGEPLEPEMEKCPKCGSGDRHIVAEDGVIGHEMVDIKEKPEGSHKFTKHSVYGEKVGKDGEIARETRIIDRKTGRYYHLIEKQDEKGEWVTKHEENEPLEQHRPKNREAKEEKTLP